MKFVADDGRFGIVVTPVDSPRMFHFQLIVSGRLLGDSEPCIIGSAVKRLGCLRNLVDPRLGAGVADPGTLMRLLQDDDELHDAATLSLAESLDNWLLCGYRYGDDVVFVAREYRMLVTSGEVFVAVVDSSLYDSIIEMFRIYWQKSEGVEV